MDEQQRNDEKKFFERQLVVFRIGKEEFGVDINDVREIIKMGDVTQIPNAESYILGVINLRGKIIVIVDLARKLGVVSSEHDKNTRVIITEVDGNTLGMVVDSCNEVLRITGDKIEPAPATITQKINSDYIQGVGIIDERLLILLDLGKVLESDDLDSINRVKKRHETKDESESRNKKKVLVVDDSSMMRATIKSYITGRDFEVIEASDGEEAVSIATSEKPELVFMDIKMPKLNGIEALKKIKKSCPNTAVVMETSVYDEKTKDECMKAGAAKYLKKPINKKDIVEALEGI